MSSTRALFGFLVVALWMAAPASARADDERVPVEEERVGEEHEEEPLAAGQRRAVPDYDGRPDPPPDAADAALWIPRVLFSPIYFVTEYVLRRPLSWVMTEVERAGGFESLLDFFTFGEDRQAGIVPTFFYEFGFLPSVGIYAFWNRFLFDENRIAVHAATFGPDWLRLTVSERIRPSHDIQLTARFDGLRRPDFIFRGIGWNAAREPRARYSSDRYDVSFALMQMPWRRTRIRYVAGWRTASFESNPYWGDPGVVQTGQIPAGFFTGYQSVRVGAQLVLDTREILELPTGGVRLIAHVGHHVGFGPIPTSRWLRWGGSLMLATDVMGRGRVLALTGVASLITPLDEGNPLALIPFTELIEAGGTGPLQGFRTGEILGQSVAAVSVSYAWPLWVWLDAQLRATVGNAFGYHFVDFALERLRLSFDLSVLPRIDGTQPIEIVFGIGTETFTFGTDIVTWRFGIVAREELLP